MPSAFAHGRSASPAIRRTTRRASAGVKSNLFLRNSIWRIPDPWSVTTDARKPMPAVLPLLLPCKCRGSLDSRVLLLRMVVPTPSARYARRVGSPKSKQPPMTHVTGAQSFWPTPHNRSTAQVPGGLFLGAYKSEPWLGRTARARGLTTVKGGSGDSSLALNQKGRPSARTGFSHLNRSRPKKIFLSC